MLKKILRKVSSFTKSDRKKFDEYLESQHFYPISYTEPKDVFIAGYPKSGNTWMQNLLGSLIYGVDPQFLPDRLTQELIPDMHTKRYYKRFLPVTCFKTHSLPQPAFRKVIHLVRDGRDVMASYFAMNKMLGKNLSLEEMIVDGKGLFPCRWHEHSRQWIENPYDAEIIMVKYEELLTNPYVELTKICSFIGLTRSEDVITNCINGNSFQSMQDKERKYGRDNRKWKSSNMFVRKGRSGVYQSEIPDHLINIFVEKSKSELDHFGYS